MKVNLVPEGVGGEKFTGKGGQVQLRGGGGRNQVCLRMSQRKRGGKQNEPSVQGKKKRGSHGQELVFPEGTAKKWSGGGGGDHQKIPPGERGGG